MSRSTIALALLISVAGALSASAATAPAFNSQAYDQAKDLAAGSASPAAMYDGSNAKGMVSGRVNEALSTGGLVPPAPIVAPKKQDLTAPVPSPDEVGSHGKMGALGLGLGLGGAAAGGYAGFLLGGPIGALLGAAMGFAIGYLLSKLLH
jgi:hypothetical protein